MSCGMGHRHSLDLVLLWLWRRLAAAAPIALLAWEPPCATGTKGQNPAEPGGSGCLTHKSQEMSVRYRWIYRNTHTHTHTPQGRLMRLTQCRGINKHHPMESACSRCSMHDVLPPGHLGRETLPQASILISEGGATVPSRADYRLSQYQAHSGSSTSADASISK